MALFASVVSNAVSALMKTPSVGKPDGGGGRFGDVVPIEVYARRKPFWVARTIEWIQRYAHDSIKLNTYQEHLVAHPQTLEQGW
jgi:hypothetical protein